MVELGATLRGVTENGPFTPDASTLRRTSILTLSSPDGDIDLLVSPSGSPAYDLLVSPSGSPAYDLLRARADRVTMDGISLLVASLDDLETMNAPPTAPRTASTSKR